MPILIVPYNIGIMLLLRQSLLRVITPTLNTPTVITSTLNTPTVITLTLNTPTVITPTLIHLLLLLLILRQWPMVFAILTLLAIQMQYGTTHLTWKGHSFYPGVRSFFSYAAQLFLKLFSAAQQNIFYKRKYYFM